MSPVLRLGLRLSAGSPGQRWRPLLVALAAAVGVVVVVVVKAEADRRLVDTGYSSTEIGRLKLAVVGSVALPVVVLVASVSRVSADLRDRRLANLRLMGLSPAQTRTVAVVEAASAAVVGAVLGAGLAALAVALGPDRLDPATLVGTVVAVVAVSVAVSAGASRRDAGAALARARRAQTASPAWWRPVPLIVGLVLCLVVGPDATGNVTGLDVTLLFAGIAALGLGLVLVVPVFVRLVAEAVLRLGRRPATLIAARRLQGQPAAVSRVVAGLMIGLFLISGARCVVSAFEGSHYRDAAANLHRQQLIGLDTGSQRAQRSIASIRALPGVRSVSALPVIEGHCPRFGGRCQILVATCEELGTALPGLQGCTGAPQWLIDVGPTGGHLALGSTHRDATRLPSPASSLTGDYAGSALVVVPPKLVPPALLGSARSELIVSADPGRNLADQLQTLGLRADPPDYADYDFVVTLRHVVWLLAAVILAVGLLSFAVSAIDRAASRRRELVTLRLVGTPLRVLRTSQWLEAAVPTATGAVLAVLLGLVGGHAYLRLVEGTPTPWTSVGTLAGIAALAAVVVSGLTVLAVGARLTPDTLRTE